MTLDTKKLRNLGDAARFLVDDYDLRRVDEDAWPHKMAMLAAAIEDAADEIDDLRDDADGLVDQHRLIRVQSRFDQMQMERNRLRMALRRSEHTLATIRAEYARYLTHHDTYELARAVGQLISEPVDVLPEDQRVVVRHPDDETSSDA